MIDYIHAQLSVWGKAQVAGSRRGLGFSPVCPMFKDARHGGGYRSSPPIGVGLTDRQTLDDTEEAVRRLGREQRRLVVEFYVVGGRSDDIAARLGIARQRLYERLHVVHQAVLGLLLDVVAGIPASVSTEADQEKAPVDTVRTELIQTRQTDVVAS